MEITFLGHAGVALHCAGHRIFIDPFITHHAGAQAAGLRVDGLELDELLLTHGHEDHVADAPAFAQRTGVVSIANYEVAMWLKDQGAQEVIPMNHGGVLQRPYGSVRMVNAVHSSTLPDGTPGGNPAGFVIESEGKRIYHAGDTALHMDMELIGRHWRPDLAFLPIGDCFTMGPEDALIAAEMIQCQRIVGIHLDTFPPIALSDDRKARAVAAFAEAGKTLILPSIGETLTV
jgi:L-ascorbate metabolism protein UlaG (beta-lactamase superfamily)